MKRLLHILILVIVSSMQAQNPSCTLSGRVSDNAGNPLAFATVLLDELKQGVLTDDHGVYSISKVP
ncbi:MAG: carboxypeptidase-like regulatory domain-containing protein, partial [Arenibacter troitsensis]|nr:carboxypeptidase-like regulatory domain-containing protein [Arenibacter troitsensis]